MNTWTAIIVTLVSVAGLTFLSFGAMFLVEHLYSEHQEHLEDYEEED